jgi:hypothetical protein
MSNWTQKPHNVSNKAHVLDYVTKAGAKGVTVVEVRHDTGFHHGQASGSLSMLALDSKVSRLAEQRDGYSVYVMAGLEAGRTVIPR